MTINVDKKHHHHQLGIFTDPLTKWGDKTFHPGVLRCITCGNKFLQWLGYYEMEMLHDLIEGRDDPPKPSKKQVIKHIKDLIKERQKYKYGP